MNTYFETNEPRCLQDVRRLLIKVICLALLLNSDFFVRLYAQENHTSISSAEGSGHRIKFERISLEQGLSESIVECILQDSQGFMWFATEDGLNKYDGYSFVTVYQHDSSNPNSLSHNDVKCVHEDHAGLLWIGTNGGGLNKFDPATERFTRYQVNPNDPNSLASNSVTSICEDQSGTMWIGTTSGGLNKFDPRVNRGETERFVRYQADPNEPNSLSHNDVRAIYEDRSGVLWIGTNGGGLKRLVPPAPNSSGRGNEEALPSFIQYRSDPNDAHSLSSNRVYSIYEDRSGVLWIGTFGGGLNKLIPSDGEGSSQTFVHYKHDANDPFSLSHDNVKSIYEDQMGVLWIGTDGGGLNKFDRERGRFIHYRNDPNDPYTLSSDRVYSVFEDRSCVLWIGTYGAGLNKLDLKRKKFAHYRRDPNDPNSLNHDIVWSICEDQSGVLWIGTNDGGLNRLDRRNNEYSHYERDPNDPNSLSHNSVRVVFEDRSGVLWIGTNGGGLNEFDKESEKFVRYQNDPDDSNTLSHNQIRSIYQDRAGVLWIGTLGGGLNRLVPSDSEGSPPAFLHYQYNPDDPNSLSSNFVRPIYEDRSGVLWIGTTAGLAKLVAPGPGSSGNESERSPPTFVHYRHHPNNPSSLSNNTVFSIHEDRAGVLWIGTFGGGLNKFDRAKETFTHYTERNGLPNDAIYGILEDERGNLWLSTNKGLSRFDPRTETFKNYNVKDGLQSDEFDGGAYFKSPGGEMFFGGINGFNAFYPNDIKDNPFIPPVVITDFQLFNKSVIIGQDEEGRSILKRSITETEEIELFYKDNVFSFEFAALDYTNPEKNQYEYMMEGFDEQWSLTDSRKRFVTYTNLDPGEYVFKVKGSNNDGLWNEEGTAIRIIITPPFWQTLWFRGSMLFSVLFSAYVSYRRRMSKIEAKRKALEIQVKEKTEAAQALQNALDQVERLKNRLQAENVYLQDEIRLVHNFENIITRSETLKRVLSSVEQVASTDATVLILGESGTGKELLARAVHGISPRGERPLVKVNCSALPANLIESELFGHEKGAFTGAISRKIGRFELASGGTIFLDEIGDLPLELQVKLLRILQDGEFERLGNVKTFKVDVRVIAATNRDLEKEIENGNFREDLYYRLNVFPIEIIPLRERKEDIPLLVSHFIKKYSTKMGKKIEAIPQNILDTLQSYRWPGNVRELENIIERAVIISQGKKLVLGDWLPKSGATLGTSNIGTLEETEKHHIVEALEMTGWRVSGDKGAARLLGLNPETLESRMKKLNIKRKR